MARNKNRYQRKRYHQIKNAYREQGGSDRWHKKTVSGKRRAAIRLALHRTSLEDDWDVYSDIENNGLDWDAFEGHYAPYNYSHSYKRTPSISEEEARRLPGRILHDWKETRKNNYSYQPGPWKYVDFEKLYQVIYDIYFTDKLQELERRLQKRDWDAIYCWNRPPHSALFFNKFPAITLLRNFLKSLNAGEYYWKYPYKYLFSLRTIAYFLQDLGYCVWTSDLKLQIPVEERDC